MVEKTASAIRPVIDDVQRGTSAAQQVIDSRRKELLSNKYIHIVTRLKKAVPYYQRARSGGRSGRDIDFALSAKRKLSEIYADSKTSYQEDLEMFELWFFEGAKKFAIATAEDMWSVITTLHSQAVFNPSEQIPLYKALVQWLDLTSNLNIIRDRASSLKRAANPNALPSDMPNEQMKEMTEKFKKQAEKADRLAGNFKETLVKLEAETAEERPWFIIIRAYLVRDKRWKEYIKVFTLKKDGENIEPSESDLQVLTSLTGKAFDSVAQAPEELKASAEREDWREISALLHTFVQLMFARTGKNSRQDKDKVLADLARQFIPLEISEILGYVGITLAILGLATLSMGVGGVVAFSLGTLEFAVGAAEVWAIYDESKSAEVLNRLTAWDKAFKISETEGDWKVAALLFIISYVTLLKKTPALFKTVQFKTPEKITEKAAEKTMQEVVAAGKPPSPESLRKQIKALDSPATTIETKTINRQQTKGKPQEQSKVVDKPVNSAQEEQVIKSTEPPIKGNKVGELSDSSRMTEDKGIAKSLEELGETQLEKKIVVLENEIKRINGIKKGLGSKRDEFQKEINRLKGHSGAPSKPKVLSEIEKNKIKNLEVKLRKVKLEIQGINGRIRTLKDKKKSLKITLGKPGLIDATQERRLIIEGEVVAGEGMREFRRGFRLLDGFLPKPGPPVKVLQVKTLEPGLKNKEVLRRWFEQEKEVERIIWERISKQHRDFKKLYKDARIEFNLSKDSSDFGVVLPEKWEDLDFEFQIVILVEKPPNWQEIYNNLQGRFKKLYGPNKTLSIRFKN